jgi:hypothetical protein
MAICRLYQQSSLVHKAIPKILYIAPIKQLVTEKRLEWERCHIERDPYFNEFSLCLQLFCVPWLESDGTDRRYEHRESEF